VQLKNLEGINKLLEFEVSKNNDLYVIPPVASTSQLVHSGFKISFHPSGETHLRFHRPISCLSLGPKIKLPFSRTEFVKDIISKRESLLSEEVDLRPLNGPGLITVLKTESLVMNFLNSVYNNEWLNNAKYVDYYNLVLTNPYYPTSYFRKNFPYKHLDINVQQITNQIRNYEGDNLHELFLSLRNDGNIVETDMVGLAPNNGSRAVIMLGNGKGLMIDLNDIEETIKKMPGAGPFFDVIKAAHQMFVD
jgi:hypothetical protein